MLYRFFLLNSGLSYPGIFKTPAYSMAELMMDLY